MDEMEIGNIKKLLLGESFMFSVPLDDAFCVLCLCSLSSAANNYGYQHQIQFQSETSSGRLGWVLKKA
jgi:hypothetical protein